MLSPDNLISLLEAMTETFHDHHHHDAAGTIRGIRFLRISAPEVEMQHTSFLRFSAPEADTARRPSIHACNGNRIVGLAMPNNDAS